MMPLSLLAAYDDLIRCSTVLSEASLEPEFIRFALNQEECRKKWLAAVQESQRLQMELEKANQNIVALEGKLHHARRILDKEKKQRFEAQKSSAALERKLNLVRDLVFVDGGAKINNETLEKLEFLKSFAAHDDARRSQDQNSRLNTITEAIDSTGSLLSDLSYSRSEDDLDYTLMHSGRVWKKHRASLPAADSPAAKKRRSSGIEKTIELDGPDTKDGRVVATTTVTVEKNGGPITASAKLETIPGPQQNYHKGVISGTPYGKLRPTAPPDSTESDEFVHGPLKTTPLTPRNFVNPIVYPAITLSTRTHIFWTKTVICPETCGPCGKRIKFGKVAMKCQDCRTICHPECKEQVALPCVPVGNTPTRRGGPMGTIADYAPPTAPMVPSLIVHCVNEIESRGLHEVGIYRVPGAEKDVRGLKEKFLKCKGVPNLSKLDVHVICGTVKDFLRSLLEPLVTHTLWKDFVKAADTVDPDEARSLMYNVISELPQPNRDTLAFLIMHLKRVADSPDCKMPASNLAKVFGPTLVGFSSNDPAPAAMFTETMKQVGVMELLLSIPYDYWTGIVDLDSIAKPQSEIYLTPSTEYLLPASGGSSTSIYGGVSKTFRSRGRRYFGTPHLNVC